MGLSFQEINLLLSSLNPFRSNDSHRRCRFGQFVVKVQVRFCCSLIPGNVYCNMAYRKPCLSCCHFGRSGKNRHCDYLPDILQLTLLALRLGEAWSLC